MLMLDWIARVFCAKLRSSTLLFWFFPACMTMLPLASGAVAKPFVHPGLLHTEADFKRMRDKVEAGAEPWASAYKVLTSHWTAKDSQWTPHATKEVIRGGPGENFGTFANDIAVAYGSALRWKISGDKAYADNTVRILNAWGSTLKKAGGDPNSQLLAINAYQLANVGEIMRAYPGWSRADFANFQKMMKEVFRPMCSSFLKNHMGQGYSFMWASWDLLSMNALYAIGVLCDDREMTTEALRYFAYGLGQGNINRTVNFLHPGYLGQTQEAGRDQGHNTLEIAFLSTLCEMAWNQGVDLYGYDNNRVLAGAEYVAKYNLGEEVPFAPYGQETGFPRPSINTEVSSYGRGIIRPGWERLYNHYVNRKGLAAPYTAAMAAKKRPSSYEGQDQPGFDTLTASLDPIASGANPSGLTILVTAQQPVLSWWGSAYATGYTVKRATAVEGPYAVIAAGVKTNTYTDTATEAGKTYFYTITATRPTGRETGPSNVARAIIGNSLVTWLKFDETGTVAEDATEQRRNGTCVNGPTRVKGVAGNALQLSSKSKAYVSLPEGIVADLSDFTISSWVYLDSPAKPWSRIFDFGTGTERYLFLTPSGEGGKAAFSITSYGGNGSQKIIGHSEFPSGRWVHVAVTLSGQTGTLYVDGVPVGENKSMFLSPCRLPATNNNWIGRSQYESDPYLDGKVDDFRIYRGALSAAEIQTLAKVTPR
jgi:hypothetical protein